MNRNNNPRDAIFVFTRTSDGKTFDVFSNDTRAEETLAKVLDRDGENSWTMRKLDSILDLFTEAEEADE